MSITDNDTVSGKDKYYMKGLTNFELGLLQYDRKKFHSKVALHYLQITNLRVVFPVLLFSTLFVPKFHPRGFKVLN